jgi:hypothetical protein
MLVKVTHQTRTNRFVTTLEVIEIFSKQLEDWFREMSSYTPAEHLNVKRIYFLMTFQAAKIQFLQLQNRPVSEQKQAADMLTKLARTEAYERCPAKIGGTLAIGAQVHAFIALQTPYQELLSDLLTDIEKLNFMKDKYPAEACRYSEFIAKITDIVTSKLTSTATIFTANISDLGHEPRDVYGQGLLANQLASLSNQQISDDNVVAFIEEYMANPRQFSNS